MTELNSFSFSFHVTKKPFVFYVDNSEIRIWIKEN